MTLKPKPGRTILSVSALNFQVKGVLERGFPDVWVAGEVTGLSRAQSGHWYFTLKDDNAQLKAVIYRGVNMRLRFPIRDGLQVLARGRISVWEPTGLYQFNIEEMEPRGVGAAELALRELKEKLLTNGYFSPARKKPLVRFPRRVALVTSAVGAAIRDMLELLSQRWPLTEVIVRHCRVQGEGAAEEIARSVRGLNRLHYIGALRLDAIVVGRGGGSSEDLCSFNEECVADAIFLSVVPVISAIGHETDVTIADLVADHRAETPSAAIMALTPHRHDIIKNLGKIHRQMREAMEHRLDLLRQRLNHIENRPQFRRPLQRLRDLEQRLDLLASRMQRAMVARQSRSVDKLRALAAHLEGLSPLKVLERGYSLTTGEGGHLIRDAKDVQPGDRVVTRVANGEFVSRVERPVLFHPEPSS